MYLHKHGYTNGTFTEGDEIEVAGEKLKVRGVHWDRDTLIVSPFSGRATLWDDVRRISLCETPYTVIRNRVAEGKKTCDAEIANPELLAAAPGSPVENEVEEKLRQIALGLPQIRRWGSDLFLPPIRMKAKVGKNKVRVKLKVDAEKLPVQVELRGKKSLFIVDVKVRDGQGQVEIPFPFQGRKFTLTASAPGFTPASVELKL